MKLDSGTGGAAAGPENVPRERLEEMARAIREALPRCGVDLF